MRWASRGSRRRLASGALVDKTEDKTVDKMYRQNRKGDRRGQTDPRCRLLFVVEHEHTDAKGKRWSGCPACARYEEMYGQELIRSVRAQKIVNMSRVVYVKSDKGAVLAPGQKKVHPQLRSHILGFPTFILVNEKNYEAHDETLEAFVFGRTFEGREPRLDYSGGYSPEKIMEWLDRKMPELSTKKWGPIHDHELYERQRAKFVPGLTSPY